MPTPEKHFNQYNKNRKFLNALIQQNSIHYDWIVTIAFYSALHLIDQFIVSQNSSFKPDDHKKRNNLVGRVDKLKPIREEYLSLQLDSHYSRYSCIEFNKEMAEKSIKKLEKIETLLCN